MTLILRSLSATFGHGHVVGMHRHGWGQLVYAARGAVAVETPETEWLVPPARAVWLPPGAAHRLQMQGTAQLRTIYLEPARAALLGGTSRGVEVSDLLRALVLHIASAGPLDDGDRRAATLCDLLADLLEQADTLPFRLRLPSDPRALRACTLMRRQPGSTLSLDRLAAHAGASDRTLQRLFVAETGIRVSEWRQAARLSHAATRLLGGASVTEAGLAAGYASTSAFVSAFRRQTGVTPSAYRGRG